MSADHNDPKALLRVAQSVYPLCELDREAQQQLARHGRLDLLKPGGQFAASDDSGWLTFLVRGELALVSEKGNNELIQANSPRARLPLFKLHLRGLNAVAKQASIVVRFDRALYQRLQEAASAEPADEGEEIIVLGESAPVTESPLYTRIYQAYDRDEITLPSLPDVALRIREAIKDPAVGVKDVAKMVLADPALSARLIHVANSAAYRRDAPVTTVYQAVTRLGLEASQNIAIGLAVKHLFRAESPLLKQRMQALYEHSTQIASIAYVLARHSQGFNPERALLAGLLHDIGIIPILSFADQHRSLTFDAAELDRTVERLRGLSSHLVLSRLGFDDDLIVAAEQAEHWLRDDRPAPDYADIIIVAQLHNALGTPHMQHLPRIDTTPAYRKLNLGEFDPQRGLAIVREAGALSTAINQLLH